MRLANLQGRAHILVGAVAFDLAQASSGRFPAEPQSVYGEWDQLREWVANADWDDSPAGSGVAVDTAALGAPAPHPRQVFAIGLNYRQHAAEAKLALPTVPVVFTKFPSCLAAPYSDIPLPSENVDWEVELVVVVGRQGVRVREAQAWPYIAGVAIGQDISERVVQHQPPIPQFSMGKSFAAFGPFGPSLVSPDDLADPDDVEVRCAINGQEVQRASTSDLIFAVPELVAYLSSITTLYPGDVIFTGTPSGVGGSRDPKWFLRAGDVIESEASGVGVIRNRCVAGPVHSVLDGSALAGEEVEPAGANSPLH